MLEIFGAAYDALQKGESIDAFF
jgi:hypothetical protein